jgi:hypothetical protein
LLKSGHLEEEEGDGRHKKWMFVFEVMGWDGPDLAFCAMAGFGVCSGEPED